jgi:hypothetical protein
VWWWWGAGRERDDAPLTRKRLARAHTLALVRRSARGSKLKEESGPDVVEKVLYAARVSGGRAAFLAGFSYVRTLLCLVAAGR